MSLSNEFDVPSMSFASLIASCSRMSKADREKYNEAQTKLAGLRQEAMDLVAPVLRRLLVSYSESLAQAALEAEARLEANGLPIRNGNEWVLHQDAICRALLSCRVKVEKPLFELQPLGAVGAVQFFLCSAEQEPHTPFSWSQHFGIGSAGVGVPSGAG